MSRLRQAVVDAELASSQLQTPEQALDLAEEVVHLRAALGANQKEWTAEREQLQRALESKSAELAARNKIISALTATPAFESSELTTDDASTEETVASQYKRIDAVTTLYCRDSRLVSRRASMPSPSISHVRCHGAAGGVACGNCRALSSRCPL